MSLRSLAAAIALVAAGLSWLGPDAQAEEPRVSAATTHENVSVYLLRGTSAGGPVPLTLDEALAKGAIEVVETGNVRELQIENTGAEPVFVQFGDIVKGGRQDRVLTVSLLLEPKSGRLPIGAYCVEQGRWSGRDKEDAHRFARSEAQLPSAKARIAIARPPGSLPPAAAIGGPRRAPIEAELNAAGERDALIRQQRQTRPGEVPAAGIIAGLGRGGGDSQGEVWRSVDQLQRRLSDTLATTVANERSRTSLQLSLENEKLKAAQAAYVAALEPAGLGDDDVVGVAVAIDGRIASADLYPSNALFRKMWPKLLRAAATEALATKAKPGAAGPVPAPLPAPSLEQVRAFLAQADTGSRSERSLGSLATIETREAGTVLSVRSAAGSGRLVHRSYMAK